MIAELNKIAIIHLFLLGFEDELTNFSLGLNNPSKQSDLLGVEVWKEKITLYKDAVAEIQNSVAPVSASWAKKHILGFSDEEIRLDIQQQRIERAVAAELAKTGEIISKTGLFDNIDALYVTKTGGTATAGTEPAGGGETGGGMDMGMDMGGGSSSSSEPSEPAGESEPPSEPTVPERFKRDDMNLILEDTLFGETDILDLSKGRNSIIEINDKLKHLIDK
jgi:hypothetical protein